MQNPVVAVFLMLVFLTSYMANANNVMFFQQSACNQKAGNHIACNNFPIGFCCHTTAPLCGAVTCDGCPQDTIITSYTGTDCRSQQLVDSCTVRGRGGWCCHKFAATPTCAASWAGPVQGKHRVRDVSLAATGNGTAGSGNNTCMGSVEPNKMAFSDDQGVRRELDLPTGTLNAAVAHLQGQNWMALGQFPAWGEFFLPLLYLMGFIGRERERATEADLRFPSRSYQPTKHTR